jgi:hypothetical protein
VGDGLGMGTGAVNGAIGWAEGGGVMGFGGLGICGFSFVLLKLIVFLGCIFILFGVGDGCGSGEKAKWPLVITDRNSVGWNLRSEWLRWDGIWPKRGVLMGSKGALVGSLVWSGPLFCWG